MHVIKSARLIVSAMCAAAASVSAQGASAPDDRPSAAWLSLLPEGETKRRFVLDCTGCHQFDGRIALADGSPRTESQWREAVDRMLGYAGATSSFPVMAAGRDPDSTAAWLARSLGRRRPEEPSHPAAEVVPDAVTEFPLPVPADLPHDVAVDADGTVIVTGMFTHQMYLLSPASGAISTIAIPRPNANPRAVDIDQRGNWWVVLGMPQTLARFVPGTAQWDFFAVDAYPHSLAVSEDAVWYNGHFTYQPEIVGRVDVATGEVTRFTVPHHPMGELAPAGPIPYEIRVAPDGAVWGSELQGNRVFRLEPATGAFKMFTMPDRWSGPRRLDVDRDGIVWIPAYAADVIYRLDPVTEEIRTISLPVADALPYVVRASPSSAELWIGTAAADAVLRLDTRRTVFTVYPTPSRGALIRHLAIAPESGDVWAAYGASPGPLPAIVARIVHGQGGGGP